MNITAVTMTVLCGSVPLVLILDLMTDNLAQKNMTWIKSLIQSPQVQQRFNELLGNRASGYITTLMSIVNSNQMLQDSDPMTIYTAAVKAAAMKLPIEPSLGFAYIVPFKNKKSGKTEAQFQLGYKGLIQIALRSRLIKTISMTPVLEWQVLEQDKLTGYRFNRDAATSDKIVWYAAYIETTYGFQKTEYMTVEEIEAHAKAYSMSYRQGYGPWKTQYDAMAQKTVLKALLSKYAPMSVDIEEALVSDQAVINEDMTVSAYIDNDEEEKVALDFEEKLQEATGSSDQWSADESSAAPVSENVSEPKSVDAVVEDQAESNASEARKKLDELQKAKKELASVAKKVT